MNDIEKKINEISLEKTKESEVLEFKLASLWKIFFTRLLDLIISSLPFLIIGIVLNSKDKTDNWYLLIINYASALIINFIYFVLIPYFLKGKTIGKLITDLKLIKNNQINKISFNDILYRELWMSIGPWFVYAILNFVFIYLAFKFNQTKNESYYYFINVVYQLNNVIYFVWLAGLMVSIKMQKNHQCFVDLKRQIIVVDGKQLNLLNNINEKESKTLKKTPGVLKVESIQSIDDNFKKSINLDKKDLSSDLKNEKSDNKKIENKGENGK